MYDTWYRMAALLRSGLAAEIAPVITHRFPYTRFEEAFAAARAGTSGKVVLDWE
jgi:threonine 3-dehydrogenase